MEANSLSNSQELHINSIAEEFNHSLPFNKLVHSNSLPVNEMNDEKMEVSENLTQETFKQKNKREKSLGILSQKFIKLFLTWNSVLTLEQAARKLSNDKLEENKIKTKVSL